MGENLIVFVCTGNVCRSPMAEYILRKRLGLDSHWHVCSAGVSAGLGMLASPEAVEVLEEKGIDLMSHVSRPLTDALVEDARVIVVMTQEHLKLVVSRFPRAKGKVFLLRSFDDTARSKDVDDPIGTPSYVYRRVRDEIAAAVPGLVDYLRFIDEQRGSSD